MQGTQGGETRAMHTVVAEVFVPANETNRNHVFHVTCRRMAFGRTLKANNTQTCRPEHSKKAC